MRSVSQKHGAPLSGDEMENIGVAQPANDSRSSERAA